MCIICLLDRPLDLVPEFEFVELLIGGSRLTCTVTT